MSGGGSTSGAIDFPVHMKEIHKNWIGYDNGASLLVPVSSGNSINDLINDALANNPFANATLTAPTDNITAINNEITALKNSISNINEEVDWREFLKQAENGVKESTLLSRIDISDLLEKSRRNAGISTKDAVEAAFAMTNNEVLIKARDAFEKRADKTRIRAINRFSGGMLDINAVSGSAFILGLALIESEHMDSVNEFDANLSTEMYSQGVQTFVQLFSTELQSRVNGALEGQRFQVSIMSDSVRLMSNVMLKKVELEQAVLSVLFETNRLDIVATQEYETSDIDLDAKYANWGFDNYTKSANVLASISGASAVLPEKPSRAASALGGALGGASAGSALGPPGMAAGALLGGVAGLLS